MNEKELVRKLNSVGKAIFIEYFYLFQSYADDQISKEDCINTLVEKKVSNENGAAIRCSNAKPIFNFQKEIDALEIIIQSKRLSPEIIKNARILFDENFKPSKRIQEQLDSQKGEPDPKKEWKEKERQERIMRKKDNGGSVLFSQVIDNDATAEDIPNRRYVPIIVGIIAIIIAFLIRSEFHFLNPGLREISFFILIVFSLFSFKIAIFSSKREIWELTTNNKGKFQRNNRPLSTLSKREQELSEKIEKDKS